MLTVSLTFVPGYGLMRGTCVFVALLAIPAVARGNDDPTAPPPDWTVSGSAAVASQYRYRGLAQSDNRPVIQGAFTVTHASGLYASVWGSSASGGDSPIQIGGTEIDIFGGYSHELGRSGVTADGGLFGYLYPGATRGNFYEIYGSLTDTLGPVSGKIGAAFAPGQPVFDYNLSSAARDNLYAYAELTSAIPQTPFTLHAHFAHTGGGLDYPRPYFDYSVGTTVKWKRLAFDAALVGTTISHDDFVRSGLVPGGSGRIDQERLNAFYRMAKPVVVVSITASF